MLLSSDDVVYSKSGGFNLKWSTLLLINQGLPFTPETLEQDRLFEVPTHEKTRLAVAESTSTATWPKDVQGAYEGCPPDQHRGNSQGVGSFCTLEIKFGHGLQEEIMHL